MSLPDFSALGLASAIRRKEVSPVEAASHFLATVDRRNPELNAFTWRRDEALMAEAKAAEAVLMSGGEHLPPFFGVPLPIKELTEVAGEPLTYACQAQRNKIGRVDSTTITKLREAGFLFMGRTNSPEFGTFPVTENKLFGASRNPFNPSHTPGGSSGGAAAAVAAGMAPIAHASDGGGSIRIPASCCGLVGLKASRGRIPKGPLVTEILHGFSTDGCVSRTIADSAAFLDATADFDPGAWMTLPRPNTSYLAALKTSLPRLRIGFSLQSPYSSIEVAQSCIDAVTKTATILADLGHSVFPHDIKWPFPEERLTKDFISVWSTLAAFPDIDDWSQVESHNRQLRSICEKQSSIEYLHAVIRLQIFSKKVLLDWGQHFDVLLTPTLAIEPPPIGWLYATGETDAVKLLRRSADMVPYTSWCNVTGQPALSVPTFTAPSGLPVGVQLVGPPAREDMLLCLGLELEKACGWADHIVDAGA